MNIVRYAVYDGDGNLIHDTGDLIVEDDDRVIFEEPIHIPEGGYLFIMLGDKMVPVVENAETDIFILYLDQVLKHID